MGVNVRVGVEVGNDLKFELGSEDLCHFMIIINVKFVVEFVIRFKIRVC